MLKQRLKHVMEILWKGGVAEAQGDWSCRYRAGGPHGDREDRRLSCCRAVGTQCPAHTAENKNWVLSMKGIKKDDKSCDYHPGTSLLFSDRLMWSEGAKWWHSEELCQPTCWPNDRNFFAPNRWRASQYASVRCGCTSWAPGAGGGTSLKLSDLEG